MTTDRVSIEDRLHVVQQNIVNSADNAQRMPNEIKLLAVSKTKPVPMIREAYAYGQRLFGENYVQEGIQKVQETRDLKDIEWHFIGPIQSNKTSHIAQYFDWVHSIDREKIARRLNEQRPLGCEPLNVLIQINIDAEASKAGIALSELPLLADSVSKCTRLRLRGIMAIPSPNATKTQQHRTYGALHRAFKDLCAHFPSVDTLSLGMSDDLDVAIQHGSTLVRVGTAIFGSRNQQKPTSLEQETLRLEKDSQ